MDERIDMLSQPLTTEEGFLNEACMNELAAWIKATPEPYERFSGDPEWSTPAWTGANEIVGLLARYAIQQANGIPPKLTEVAGFALAAVNGDERFESVDDIGKFANVSLCDVNKMLWSILGGLTQFDGWNEKTIMEPLGLQWIDLSALLRNVCIALRNDRRHDAAFDRKFEKEYGNGA